MDWDRKSASEEEMRWRQSTSAWTIPDFFNNLKYLFTHLHLIPTSPSRVQTAKELRNAAMLKDIYHQHGWPDLAVYRKAECMAAVEEGHGGG